MDYVVGSVAALVSGNVTPSRPKYLKRALTPTKHQPSPNVTPKSEIAIDRSIFLSPTLQKKKAIVKKSPKRIFEATDLDRTVEGEDSLSPVSPKADKVKKRLKGDLEPDTCINSSLLSPESPNTISEMSKKSPKKSKINDMATTANLENGSKPEKKNKLMQLVDSKTKHVSEEPINKRNSTKNKRGHMAAATENDIKQNIETKIKKVKQIKNNNQGGAKNSSVKSINLNKNKKKNQMNNANQNFEKQSHNSKNKNNKKPKVDIENANENYVNPNAITNEDTDSEHESDNEMESENEEIDENVSTPAEESSDEEEEVKKDSEEQGKKEKKLSEITQDEIKRTIFVGNVPFTKKCKKEIKKIFGVFGAIETIRIRTIPVKDAKESPKVALVKNELHPDRSTVNVYVKYADESSVIKALSANNVVLNEHHLRVSRSDVTGATHDPKCSIFVGNIPFALEDEGLRAKFENCGKIDSVRIIRDKRTNAGKGFGYVNFASKDGVELALALNDEDLTIKNRILRVKRCTPRAQNKAGPKAKSLPKGMKSNIESGGKQILKDGNKNTGALRRMAHKRKNQEREEGPANKRPKDTNVPAREKKQRKEFVGMTADKKKKNKVNKGQKKKIILSKIMTKK